MDIPQAVWALNQPASYPQQSKPAWEQDFRPLAGHNGMWQAQTTGSDIHPIFSQNNFSILEITVGLAQPLGLWLHPAHRMPGALYQKIRPALALATKFMKQSSAYLDIVVYGTRMEVPTEHGMRLFCQPPQHSPRSGFPSLMDKLRNIHFYWGHSPYEMPEAYGHTMAGVVPPGNPSMFVAAVQISSNFIEFFREPQYENHPQELKNVILFLLACVLVHELAHVWHDMRLADSAKQGDFKPSMQRYQYGEPHVFKDEPRLGWATGEIGHAWSRYLLGGTPCLAYENGEIDQTAKPLAPVKSLAIRLWDENYLKAPRFFCISPVLVAAFFDDQCWTRYELRYGVRHLQDTDMQQRHSSIFGTSIISRMENVLILKDFQNSFQRIPSPRESGSEQPSL